MSIPPPLGKIPNYTTVLTCVLRDDLLTRANTNKRHCRAPVIASKMRSTITILVITNNITIINYYCCFDLCGWNRVAAYCGRVVVHRINNYYIMIFYRVILYCAYITSRLSPKINRGHEMRPCCWRSVKNGPGNRYPHSVPQRWGLVSLIDVTLV